MDSLSSPVSAASPRDANRRRGVVATATTAMATAAAVAFTSLAMMSTTATSFNNNIFMTGSVIGVADALRVGCIGPFQGISANPFIAACDGVKLAFQSINDDEGGIAGQNLSWISADSVNIVNGVELMHNLTEIVDTWMSDPSTAIDSLVLPPGEALTKGLIEASRPYNLTIVTPATVRSEYLRYDMQQALSLPMLDTEIFTMIKWMLYTKRIKRVAFLSTLNNNYGAEVLPYLKKLLAVVGLEVVHHYVIEDPNNPDAAQLAAGKAARPQAVLLFARASVAALGFIVNLIMSLPKDTIMAVSYPMFPLILLAFGSVPTYVGDGRFVTTVVFPTHVEDTMSSRAFLKALRAHPNLVKFSEPYINGFNYSYGASHMVAGFMTGHAIVSVYKQISTTDPAAITSQAVNAMFFNNWNIPTMDYTMGPFSRPCFGRLKSPACGCNIGARQLSMAYFTPNFHFYRNAESEVELSLDECVNADMVLQSPLIQLIPTPSDDSATLTADEQALMASLATQFQQGDRAGYVNVSTSPSSRTGILVPFAYNGSIVPLQQAQADMLLTMSTGAIFSPNTIPTGAASAAADEIAKLPISIDPLHVMPRPYAGYEESILQFAPTLNQEMHAFLSAFPSAQLITASDSNDEVLELKQLLIKSANTFGVDGNGVVHVSSIASYLSGAAVSGTAAFIVHGIRTRADIAAIKAFLVASPSAVVMVPFAHLTVWYDVITELFFSASSSSSTAAVRERLVFVTSLPNWNPHSPSTMASSGLMEAYYAAMSEAGHPFTPQTLRGFLTQRLVANIVERIPSALTQDTFLSTLYAVSIVVLEAGVYSVGPFSNTACADAGATSSSAAAGGATDGSRGVNCEVNIGARAVFVRSLEAAAGTTANANRSPVNDAFAFMTFSSGAIDYLPLPKGEGLSDLAIALIVVFVVLGCIALLLVALKLLTGRSHSAAPKDESKAFTIVFTDIQASTNLWAEIPDDMGAALDIHHALIRSLIRRHNGYEVKTVGDAFMIAFKNPDDAVRLAYDLQFEFFNCRQFPSSIDQAYIAFEREFAAMNAINAFGVEDEQVLNVSSKISEFSSGDDQQQQQNNNNNNNNTNQYDPATKFMYSCDLEPAEYNARWRGIRVRVGINTDFGSIKRDETTLSYDYYGTVTNTAARVESVCHGGQVCMSETTFRSLNDIHIMVENVGPNGEVPSSPYNNNTYASNDSSASLVGSGPSFAVCLGQQSLRGLSNDVMFYQLECIRGRTFPPLRLERADKIDDVDNYDDGDGTTTDNNTASRGVAENRTAISQRASTTGNKDSDVASVGSRNNTQQSTLFGNQYMVATEVQSAQVAAVLLTLFSRLPPEKRSHELKKWCDTWRVRVDGKSIEKAKATWSPSNTNTNGGATNSRMGATPTNSGGIGGAVTLNNNNTNGKKALPLTEETAVRSIALGLTRDSYAMAVPLVKLAKMMRNGVSRSLHSAAVAQQLPMSNYAAPLHVGAATVGAGTNVVINNNNHHGGTTNSHHASSSAGGDSLKNVIGGVSAARKSSGSAAAVLPNVAYHSTKL